LLAKSHKYRGPQKHTEAGQKNVGKRPPTEKTGSHLLRNPPPLPLKTSSPPRIKVKDRGGPTPERERSRPVKRGNHHTRKSGHYQGRAYLRRRQNPPLGGGHQKRTSGGTIKKNQSTKTKSTRPRYLAPPHDHLPLRATKKLSDLRRGLNRAKGPLKSASLNSLSKKDTGGSSGPYTGIVRSKISTAEKRNTKLPNVLCAKEISFWWKRGEGILS